ncbi:MAG: YggS family pyridoxal phosphate-dependent enzyme [Planctomycetota bacterium]
MASTRLTSTPSDIAEALEAVNHRIAEAAARSGRTRDDVLLVAVTKYAAPDQIQKLVQLGQIDLGEGKVQQLDQRASQLNEYLSRARSFGAAGGKVPEQVRWHLIGQLQRNKVKQAAPLVGLIHSVDSLRLAEELNNYAVRRDRTIDILLQVNTSGEANKAGVTPPAAPHLCEQIDSMVHLRVRGLMTMAPHSDDPEDARPTFARCAELFREIRADEVVEEGFNILSMGMSGDFEVAIEEGANLVRVGRALFGEPEQPAAD